MGGAAHDEGVDEGEKLADAVESASPPTPEIEKREPTKKEIVAKVVAVNQYSHLDGVVSDSAYTSHTPIKLTGNFLRSVKKVVSEAWRTTRPRKPLLTSLEVEGSPRRTKRRTQWMLIRQAAVISETGPLLLLWHNLDVE